MERKFLDNALLNSRRDALHSHPILLLSHPDFFFHISIRSTGSYVDKKVNLIEMFEVNDRFLLQIMIRLMDFFIFYNNSVSMPAFPTWGRKKRM